MGNSNWLVPLFSESIGSWKCWFLMRGKPEYPDKNLSEQGREPTANSTHICRRVRESNSGHIVGRPAWEANAQPLRHGFFFHCWVSNNFVSGCRSIRGRVCTKRRVQLFSFVFREFSILILPTFLQRLLTPQITSIPSGGRNSTSSTCNLDEH